MSSGVSGSTCEAAVEARVERAVAAQREAVVELGQADEDEREQRAAVPLVVEQDVQMVERVLVEQVGLVEEEDGVDALAAELLDVGGDGVEDGGRGGRRREAEGEAELAVEVAAAEGGVVAVGEAEALLGEAVAQRAQHAGLADAGLAGEQRPSRARRGPRGARRRARAWRAGARGRRRRSPWRRGPREAEVGDLGGS